MRFAMTFSLVFLASVGAAAAQPRVNAETGGVAIGGSVSGSTINIGIPPEQLAALVRQAADLSRSAGRRSHLKGRQLRRPKMIQQLAFGYGVMSDGKQCGCWKPVGG
jgi:hypothetical protein